MSPAQCTELASIIHCVADWSDKYISIHMDKYISIHMLPGNGR